MLDPHVKALYGDSITVQRCEEIYKILVGNGFAGGDLQGKENLLETVFRDGVLVKEQTLADIRDRLNGGNFGG